MFPPRFKQTFAFKPFRLFLPLISTKFYFGFFAFRTSGVQVVSCLFHIGKEDFSLAGAQLKSLNKGVLKLSDLELPALPYVSPIAAINGLLEY